MSPSFLGIFCIFLAVSGDAYFVNYWKHLPLRRQIGIHDEWNPHSWDEYEYEFLKLLKGQRNVNPHFLKLMFEYPHYSVNEFAQNKPQNIKLTSSSFQSDVNKHNSVSTGSLVSTVHSVPSLDADPNSIQSTSTSTTTLVSSEKGKNRLLYAGVDTKPPEQDETDLKTAENTTTTESTSSSFIQDSESNSTARFELLSTETIKESDFTINSTNAYSNFTSDSASNSLSDTDSSSVQSTVLPTTDSSFSISNSPNISINETRGIDFSSTNFEQLTGEDTQSTYLENNFSIFTDSSTQKISRQSINLIIDEISTVITSGEEDDTTTKLSKASISEEVLQSSTSSILPTSGFSSSVSYMTSTSSDKSQLHESGDKLIIVQPETVIEISSIRTAKVVVSVVFLAIAVVATAVLTVYMIKIKRREVQYDQLALIP